MRNTIALFESPTVTCTLPGPHLNLHLQFGQWKAVLLKHKTLQEDFPGLSES